MNILEKQLEDPARRARMRRLFYGALVVIAAAEVCLPLIFGALARLLAALDMPALASTFRIGGSHFWFERIPAWGSLYGFASCLAIIVVSKFLGKVWLLRGEKYYEATSP